METIQQVLESVTAYLPNMLAAVAVLVGGWLVALVIAAVVRAILRRTSLDNRISAWVGGPEAKAIPVERIAHRIVFYTLMVFVLVAFLEVVGLALLTEPLNQLLNEIFVFAPRVLAAGLLLVLAWVVATALRVVVSASLNRIKVDERIGAETGTDEAPPLSQMLGDVVYWLVFLLFLPAVLGALALDGLMQPLQGMVDEVLLYLPNVLSAAIILAVGWFGARIIQRILGNLLAAVGTDRLADRMELDRALGTRPLSGLIAMLAYVLVLIPVLVAALNALGLDAVTGPASVLLGTILAAIPALFGAALVLGVAYVIGRVVGRLVSNLLEGVGFDKLVTLLGVWQKDSDAPSPSTVVGYLALVAVLLFATIEAFELLGFSSLAVLFAELTVFGGDVLIGLLVLSVGLYLANLASTTIAASKTRQSRSLALGARIAILTLAGTMALQQVGVAPQIITLAFGLTLGAVAIAAAIAFGLGGRDAAARQLDDWHRSWTE